MSSPSRPRLPKPPSDAEVQEAARAAELERVKRRGRRRSGTLLTQEQEPGQPALGRRTLLGSPE